MTVICFLFFFFTGHCNFFCIYHNNIITTIKITYKIWFFLSHQKMCNNHSCSSQSLIFAINQVPFSFYICYFCRLGKSLHIYFSFFSFLSAIALATVDETFSFFSFASFFTFATFFPFSSVALAEEDSV